MFKSLWCLSIVYFIQYFSVTSLAWQLSKVQTVLYPIAKAILPRLTIMCLFLRQNRTGILQCLQKEMATYRHWSVSLWRDPDDVPHCRILFPDKTEWRLISATLCGWRRCFVADQLWFMTRIREEEEDCMRSISSRIMCWIAPPFCFSFSRFIPLCNWFSDCLNCDLLLFVFDCLLEVQYRFANRSRQPKYTKSYRISQMQ